MMRDMSSELPLSALLSQALVAFTIELDNEFERRMPHRTTSFGAGGPAPTLSAEGHPLRRPWTVSLVMWANLLQFVDAHGVTVRELRSRARLTRLPLAGMTRWGYVEVAAEADDQRPRTPAQDLVVTPTVAGLQAKEVWRPLVAEIEQRWQERFGADDVDRLREAIAAIAAQIGLALPEYLPILGYGLRIEPPQHQWKASATAESGSPLDAGLPTLLSRVLLALTLEFEQESEVSLAICADVLRVVGDGGVRIRELPRRAGVSKAAISMAVGFLETHGFAMLAVDLSDASVKTLRLTERGQEALEGYSELSAVIERRWQARFGERHFQALRTELEALGGGVDRSRSPLMLGLTPPAGGWRESVGKPDVLPHYPMVLHRGGFPDGS
jgi:DNA-binding MarR family transcriptional regulator